MSGIIGKNSDRSSGVIGTTAGGIASLAADSSPQLGGFLDAAGNYIQMEKGGDISSASPTVIGTDGDFFAVTGTTNFSAFTVAADRHFFLEFGAVLTMTHGNGTLDLPGGANITTAASDVGEFVSTAADTVTCVNYTKRDGTAVVAAGGASTHLLYSEFAMDNATGTNLTISGVGFTPKLVIMYWVIANGAAVTLGLFGDPSLEEDSIEQREAGTDKWQITQNKMILRYTAGGDRQEFVLSAIGSDGFTLANTLAGSSPSGCSEILFACIG
jgi:hypothetical protein